MSGRDGGSRGGRGEEEKSLLSALRPWNTCHSFGGSMCSSALLRPGYTGSCVFVRLCVCVSLFPPRVVRGLRKRGAGWGWSAGPGGRGGVGWGGWWGLSTSWKINSGEQQRQSQGRSTCSGSLCLVISHITVTTPIRTQLHNTKNNTHKDTGSRK